MRKPSLCLCVFALSLLGSFPAFGQQNSKVPRQPLSVNSSYFTSLNAKAKHMAFNKLSAATNAAAKAQSPRIVSLPNFTRSFTFGGQTFPYHP